MDTTENNYVSVLDNEHEDDEDTVKEIEEALPEGCHVKTWNAGKRELNNKRKRGVNGKRIQGKILNQEQRSQLLVDLLVEERNGNTQCDGDRAFALQEKVDQEEEEQKVRLLNRNTSDMAIAQAIQIREKELLVSCQLTGKAWRLVESVVKLQQEEGQLSEMTTNATVQLSSRSTTTSRILVVAIDDMVPMAEKFLAAHAQFQNNGYHCRSTLAITGLQPPIWQNSRRMVYSPKLKEMRRRLMHVTTALPWVTGFTLRVNRTPFVVPSAQPVLWLLISRAPWDHTVTLAAPHPASTRSLDQTGLCMF